MKIQDLAVGVVVVWALSAVTAAIGSAQVTSWTDIVTLAIVGGFPPLAIWFRLNDPAETLNASIHRIREESHAPQPAAR
jgi:hypothetical protein